MLKFLTLCISGVMLGCIYSLIALGYGLIYKASGLMSFIQGDMLTLGAFLGLTFYSILGLPYWLSLLLTMLCAFAFGMLLEKGVYQVFVSLGREGLYFRRQGCGALRKKSRPFPMKNATGAGDATMAGIVYAWVNGLSPGDTLEFALGAGLAAIDSADTINPAMSPALVAKLVKEYVL